MFHQPKNIREPFEGLGHISGDGHVFECDHPVLLEQGFHV